MVNDTKYAQLMRYIEASWPLVPLHDVSSGHCSCREGAACPWPGKHPRLSGWEQGHNLVRTAADLTAWHERTAGACERWNWGLATGASSGIWVADFDPASAGDDAKLMWERLVSGAGPTVGQVTGGMGWHAFYALPPDFEPYNTQGKSRSGMPIGLDVRSHHGQVVLDPSVSGKGVYTLAERYVPKAAELARAPEWFEELHRVAWRERTAGASKAQLSADATVYSGPSSTPPVSGVHPYASAVLVRELRALRDEPVGNRNNVAFSSACALWELINSPWSGLDEFDAYYAWLAAGQAQGAPEGELLAVWQRAQARVGGGGRPEPADVRAGVLDVGGGGMFAQPGQSSQLVQGLSIPVVDQVGEFIARLLTPEQLRRKPPPEPLVNGVLDLDTTAWLIGASGSYKSFVALDLAAHVGRGEPWRGHAVKQGLVVYVAAEGSRGMVLRQAAWEREIGEMRELLVLDEPVQSNEQRTQVAPGMMAPWSVLVAAVAKLRPVLIVIDTQARVTIGLNENDNADMSYYAEQADRLKRACGACVLTVHHTGRNGTNARGASAIDGAQDAELRIERKGNLIVDLVMDKQKDQAEEAPMKITLRRSEGGTDPVTGRDLSSLVLVPAAEPGLLADPETPADRGKARMVALYKTIVDQFNGGPDNAGDGGTRADIRTAFFGLPEIADMAPESRRRMFHRTWNGLVERRLLAKRSGAERYKIIVVPDQGLDGVLTANEDTMPQAGWNVWAGSDEV